MSKIWQNRWTTLVDLRIDDLQAVNLPEWLGLRVPFSPQPLGTGPAGLHTPDLGFLEGQPLRLKESFPVTARNWDSFKTGWAHQTALFLPSLKSRAGMSWSYLLKFLLLESEASYHHKNTRFHSFVVRPLRLLHTIHLSIYHPSIHPSIHRSIDRSIYLYLFIYLCIYVFIFFC